MNIRLGISKILCLLLLVLFSATASAGSINVTYYHNDATGSPVAATNAAGAVIWRKNYTPYGEASGKDGNNRRGYTGHVEEANGLVYAGARYYNPDWVRFLSADPAGFSASNPMSFNRYAYANNNPYKYVDPDGRVIETAWDIANVVMDVSSMGMNLAAGNYGGAAVDAVGLIIDGAATALPFVPGGAGAAIKAARVAERAKEELGVIYKVAGDKTGSGMPYIGRSDDLASRTKNARDGRDREGAEIIGYYPKGNRAAGSAAEQKAINQHDGIGNLDNRRNEIAPSKWKERGVE